MTDGSLVFDIGLHIGEDTAYYLELGHRVVAVDADADHIASARLRFSTPIAERRLTLVHAAVGNTRGDVTFHVSDKPEWSSVNAAIATRVALGETARQVTGLTLADLCRQHGVPTYCKIDVEGNDLACLQSLEGHARPRYISTESECSGDVSVTEDEALATLRALRTLGYTKFKLVDQATLAVLSPRSGRYGNPLTRRILRKLRLVPPPGQARENASQRAGRPFPVGASGPFGADLAGEWVSAPEAEALLLRHRRDYFAQESASPFGFWCDWHATG